LVSIVNQNKNNNLIYEMGVTYKDNKIYLEIDHRTIGNGNNFNNFLESINSLCPRNRIIRYGFIRWLLQ